MCARFNLHSNLSLLVTQLGLPFVPEFRPRYNLAPTDSILAVITGDQGRTAKAMHWGLVPSWTNDPQGGSPLINARAETVADKPTFRAAFKSRRCLIPADGYYEWTREGKRRVPHFIHLASRQTFCFAGLWETWGRGATRLESCTIITTEASSLTRPLHERMPAILESSDYDAWLNPPTPRDELLSLLRPFPSEELQFEVVSDYVNKVGHEGPGCVKAVTARNLFGE